MDEQQWWVSPFNLLKEVLPETLPQSVAVYDSTLRDGEQTIGVSYDVEDRIRIARQLEAAGVAHIEAGMPITSKEDQKAVAEVVKTVKGIPVWTLCRCTKRDVDASAQAGVRNVMCEIATSPYKMKAYSYTEDSVLSKIVDTVKHAKANGMRTAFFAVDSTRAGLAFLERAYKSAVFEGGASEVAVVDTLGVATPEAIYYLTKLVRSWVPVPVMVHCHNDFGLAVACTVSAVRAGATTVHVTVNGLGEKTGNADLAEVVLALEGLYHVKTGIDFTHLLGLSKTVEEITHVGMSPLKPVVGDTVFQRESGVTVAQLAVYPPSVEGYPPELVGRKREIFLSKKSGTGSIEYYLKKAGIEATPEQVGRILQEVKSLGTSKKGLVTEQEFSEIVARVV